MNPANLEPRPWSRGRWVTLVALIFAAHAGLIYALVDRKPIVPRQPRNVPHLGLAGGYNELMALNDPTLFARPHAKAFSGPAWMQFQADEPPRSQASQTNRLLPLPVEQLGSAFSHFVETNFFARFKPELKPAPRPRLPDPVFVVVEAPTSSVIQLRGELARRQLLTEQVLSPVASADMLGNSVVQVLVDDAGRVISTTLSKSSGDTKADQLALDLARRSLFDPVGRDPGIPLPASSRWTSGEIVFPWVTVPVQPQPASSVP